MTRTINHISSLVTHDLQGDTTKATAVMLFTRVPLCRHMTEAPSPAVTIFLRALIKQLPRRTTAASVFRN